MKNTEETGDVFNLGKTQAKTYLADRKSNDDGLLRPKLTEAADGKRELTIRILPNLMKNGKIGPTAIEKHIHYADFKENAELAGYYDCLKNVTIGKDCPLCKTFWNLKNSKNPSDNEKMKLINRSTKYYSYAYVVEDKQVPDNEGKIFVFPFGFKIFQKIKSKAENSRKPVDVEDLVHGANLFLSIEEIGGFYNYDSSEFETPEPIEFNGKKLKIGDDGKISASEKERVVEFLKSREHELEEFVAVDWTDEQHSKALSIIEILSGNYTHSDKPNNSTSNKKTLTSSSVFTTDEDEDEDEQDNEDNKKTEAKAEKKVKTEKTEKPVEKTTADSSKKAKAFFDDEND